MVSAQVKTRYMVITMDMGMDTDTDMVLAMAMATEMAIWKKQTRSLDLLLKGINGIGKYLNRNGLH